MINWLIQSIADHPDLARGVVLDEVLSKAERARFAELKTPKRRSDWLIGRWTAKRLLQLYIEQRAGIRPQLNTLTVANDPDGAPRIIVDGRLYDGCLNLQSTICNLQLSISHRDGRAFCAVSDTRGAQIGADIERIEQRSPQFAEDYFTTYELAQVQAAPPADREALITLIWSAKEAALKALRLGLTVDTRSVSCDLGQPDCSQPDWAPLVVSCAPELRGSRGGALHGWWRRWGDYVLTIVVLHCDTQPSVILPSRHPVIVSRAMEV